MKKTLVSIIVIGITFLSHSQNKIESSGDVGIGTTNPLGSLHIKNSPMWSSANYGANLLIDGNRNNSIAFLDANSSSPLAITNHFGKFFFSKMPDLGNKTSAPTNLLTINNTGDVGIGTTNPLGTLHIKNSLMWSSANYGANLLIDGNRNNSIAFLDANSSSPLAITNHFGKFFFSKMPDLGDKTSAPTNLLTINNTGDVGIGTTNPDMKLTVNGNIHAKEVKIDLDIPAPDYVFKKGYYLRSIEEIENFIKKNSHLPEIPSAKEFKQNGIMQAEMDMNLLKKIEELTLYTIQQQKEIRRLKLIEERVSEIEKLLKSKKIK
ncbi:hypothetical protein A8C32_00685 [Flavivirga aquatica]|uniref:Peptidase S74 domain-containing protein n=1 Tax=Flavivirga aquatica TaxID=1849968 RepID=A0A1E5TBS3_9FLAO|nr:hypothetical protein [Flavivirga aquatica]OEK08825.1 hypothetical protein A8C32_00685 [Flavivirga aquatica]